MLVSGVSNILVPFTATALSKINAAMAPKPTDAASDPLGAVPEKSAKDEFLDYAKMTPAQKMRAAMLAKLGVTEEQLKAMDPKDRQKIEDQLKEMVKQQVQGGDKDKTQKGVLVDLKA
jgi:hypothetical protein